MRCTRRGGERNVAKTHFLAVRIASCSCVLEVALGGLTACLPTIYQLSIGTFCRLGATIPCFRLNLIPFWTSGSAWLQLFALSLLLALTATSTSLVSYSFSFDHPMLQCCPSNISWPWFPTSPPSVEERLANFDRTPLCCSCRLYTSLVYYRCFISLHLLHFVPSFRCTQGILI